MKKYFVMMMCAALTFGTVGCGSADASTTGASSESTAAESAVTDMTADEGTAAGDATMVEDTKSEGVMTYEEYMAADVDAAVVVEAYVQAKQAWWDDKATIYAQDMDGAYFIYDMACSQEDYERLTTGTKIQVSGYKTEWSGEVEIVDASFDIMQGSYVAEALDVTDLLGTEELIAHQNKFVAFKGMTVEDAGDGAAFMYKWDGSGSDGDDLYFNVSLNGTTYSFTVESYLCDNTTEVYNAVKNLKVGDVIDMEGFLYWYEGVNPHITSVIVK